MTSQQRHALLPSTRWGRDHHPYAFTIWMAAASNAASSGRRYRLTDVHGKVVRGVLA
ncbi:MAG: hypothetical protein ABI614_28050 [Planctomycetota bacterium]